MDQFIKWVIQYGKPYAGTIQWTYTIDNRIIWTLELLQVAMTWRSQTSLPPSKFCWNDTKFFIGDIHLGKGISNDNLPVGLCSALLCSVLFHFSLVCHRKKGFKQPKVLLLFIFETDEWIFDFMWSLKLAGLTIGTNKNSWEDQKDKQQGY